MYIYDALNDLRSPDNLDVYVTGSNSKMLSSDILTEFLHKIRSVVNDRQKISERQENRIYE